MFIGPDTKVLIQGITGHQGEYHAKSMLDSGTKVVAGERLAVAGQRCKE